MQVWRKEQSEVVDRNVKRDKTRDHRNFEGTLAELFAREPETGDPGIGVEVPEIKPLSPA